MRLDFKLIGHTEDGTLCVAHVTNYCDGPEEVNEVAAKTRPIWLEDKPGFPYVPDDVKVIVDRMEEFHKKELKQQIMFNNPLDFFKSVMG